MFHKHYSVNRGHELSAFTLNFALEYVFGKVQENWVGLK
jgi:hypothetical protein